MSIIAHGLGSVQAMVTLGYGAIQGAGIGVVPELPLGSPVVSELLLDSPICTVVERETEVCDTVELTSCV